MDRLATFGRSFVCACDLMNNNIFHTGQKLCFHRPWWRFQICLLHSSNIKEHFLTHAVNEPFTCWF